MFGFPLNLRIRCYIQDITQKFKFYGKQWDHIQINSPGTKDVINLIREVVINNINILIINLIREVVINNINILIINNQ